MTLGVLQSTLFGDMFGTAVMRAVFGELAFLARCAEVEAALARAQARIGIIPADAAAAISKAASEITEKPDSLDLPRLKRETETVGYPILPLVRQLAERAGDGGRYLHWGAAAEDIIGNAGGVPNRSGAGLIKTSFDPGARHLASPGGPLCGQPAARAPP